MKLGFFDSGHDIHPLFHEQDANSDIAGDYISMKNYERAYILFKKGGAEDVIDAAVQVVQATAAAGTGVKALAVSRCWYKTGTMTAQGTWTAVDVGSGTADDLLGFGASLPTGATRVVADVNTSALWLMIEVLAENLDVNNSFNFVTLLVEGDNLSGACLCSADIILCNGFLRQAIPPNPLA